MSGWSRSELREEHTDMALNALVVICVIGAVGALLYYLINLREVALGGSSGRLKWVAGVFVFCVVLISRIRAKQGLELAIVYQFFLALAMLVSLVRLGGGAWAGVGGWVANLAIVVAVWWVADFLTSASIIHDEDRDVSGQGVLTTIAEDFSNDPEAGGAAPPQQRRPEEADAKASEPAELSDRDLARMLSGGRPWLERGDAGSGRGRLGSDPRSPRRHPGVAIVYFSLGALLFFALGERIIAGSPEPIRQEARRYATVFAGCCLGLLMLTSLIAQRHYLRLRGITVDRRTPPFWVALGTGIVLVVLGLAWLVPAPVAASSGRAASTVGGGAKGRKTDQSISAPFAGEDESTAKNAKPPKGRSSGPHSGQQRDDSPRRGEQKGADSGKRQDRRSKGNRGQTGQGGKSDDRDGRTGGEGSSGQAKAKGRGQAKRKGQPERQPRGPRGEHRQGRAESGQKQKPAARPKTSPPHQSVTGALESLLSGLAKLLRWIVLVLLAIGGVYLLAKIVIAVARNVEGWRGWAAMLQQRLNRVVDSLKAFLARWGARLSRRRAGPAGGGGSGPAEVFSNPFRAMGDPDRLNDQEAVKQCYAGLMAVAVRLGCPRADDVTSLEYLRRLPEPLRPVRREVAQLTEMYNQACYGQRRLKASQRRQLRQVYRRLGDFTDQMVNGG